jgi:hypothetical protein
MLSLRTYAKRLNKAVPHPIFLQGDLLAEVVRREAEVELGRLDPSEGAPEGANISGMGYLQCEERTNPQLLRLPPSVDMSAAIQGPLSPQVELWWQAATWVWDELGRTDDGGIEMRVAREEIYELPKPTEGSGHMPHARVCYVVRADPWGRIIKIKRDENVKKK